MPPLPPNFSRAAFREQAKSVRVHLDGEQVGWMTPTEAGGGCGWKLTITRPETIAGCTVNVRYTLTASVVGSPALPPASAPPPAAGELFPTA